MKTWAKQTVLAIVIATLAYLTTRWAGVEIPFPLWLVVVAAVLTGRLLVVALLPPRTSELPIREDSEAQALGQLPDRPFTGARRWEERLELTRGDAAYFGRVVLPELNALVQERLRITGEPERQVEELLGERAWSFLTAATPKRVPSPAELSAVVAKLEELWTRNRPTSRS